VFFSSRLNLFDFSVLRDIVEGKNSYLLFISMNEEVNAVKLKINLNKLRKIVPVHHVQFHINMAQKIIMES